MIIDAILLSGDERNKSLSVAAAPAAIELYFFLQSWFQAAPQAIFQIHLLLRERYTDRTYQSSGFSNLLLYWLKVIKIKFTNFKNFCYSCRSSTLYFYVNCCIGSPNCIVSKI